MITKEKAQEIAERYIEYQYGKSENPAKLLYEETMEITAAWIFFYNSNAFIEENDFLKMYVGNGPFAVEKEFGKFLILPSYDVDLEKYIVERINNDANWAEVPSTGFREF